MTIYPICLTCKHLRPKTEGGAMACDAFPASIPKPILMMDHDHHDPYPGDRGIRYEFAEPLKFPLKPVKE